MHDIRLEKACRTKTLSLLAVEKLPRRYLTRSNDASGTINERGAMLITAHC